MENGINDTFYYEYRLHTFTKWPFSESDICSAQRMAEAGFYLKDPKNATVRCFLCRKVLEDWHRDDNPWDEHLRLSPRCMFAKFRLPEHELSDVQKEMLIHDIMKDGMILIITRSNDELEQTVKKLKEKAERKFVNNFHNL